MASPSLPKRSQSMKQPVPLPPQRHAKASNGPPIPDTPRPFIPGFSSPNSATHDQRYAKSPVPDFARAEEHPLTLCELVSKFSKFFPLRVKVVKGFYTERVAIPSEDIYNIHFLKRAKVVTVRDTYDDTYTIPFNSLITFGLIYDQKKDIKVFETAADLIDAPTLPNVVIAQKDFVGKDQKTSIDALEVLVLRGVHRPRFTVGHSKGTISAFSITKQEEKTLLSNCWASFSTNPYLARLHLPEIWTHIPDPNNLKVKMFWDCDDLDDLPTHLTSSVVTICGQSTESSLISTLVSDPTKSCEEAITSVDDDDSAKTLVDIPLGLDIEVVVIPPPDSETQKLYEDTREIYDSFDPKGVTVCVDMPMDEMYVTQSQFFSAVREGHETEGMLLEIPPLAYDGVVSSRHKPTDEDSSDDEYEQVEFNNPGRRHGMLAHTSDVPPTLPRKRAPVATPEDPATLPTPPKRVTAAATVKPSPMPSKSKSPLHKLPHIHIPKVFQKTMSLQDHEQKSSPTSGDDIGSLRQEVERLNSLVDRLSNTCTELQEDMKGLKGEVAAMAGGYRSGVEGEGERQQSSLEDSQTEENIRGLVVLSQSEVLELLENIGLKEYGHIFAENCMDGEILSSCDESILEEELGVSKRIHRMKLMKVIEGRYSVRKIMDGDASYVVFGHH